MHRNFNFDTLAGDNGMVLGSAAACSVKRQNSVVIAIPKRSTTRLDPALLEGLPCWEDLEVRSERRREPNPNHCPGKPHGYALRDFKIRRQVVNLECQTAAGNKGMRLCRPDTWGPVVRRMPKRDFPSQMDLAAALEWRRMRNGRLASS
jgi:hypothetical protein